MLEARIEELTVAIRDLIEIVRNTNMPNLPQSAASVVIKSYGGTSVGTVGTIGTGGGGSIGSNPPNEKSQDSQKSKGTSDTSKPSSPESPAVTYDDVKKATNAVSAKLGREKAVAGLARFGVQSAIKLSEEQWPEYVAYMTRVAAGELDPEAAE